MLRVERVADLRAALENPRRAAQRVGFVPTMGALHDGHLALIRKCREHADIVVTSIFVNPLQFGPNEDYARYPRDPDADAAKCEAAGSDVCFLPGVDAMYPSKQKIRVTADELASRWEGEIRPGHFNGVLTVVAKLFHMVSPDIAVFGQKDFQQVTLIKAMVRELNFPLSVVVAPTVRDHDGLALSSRNAYLSAELREKAASIPGAMRDLLRAFQSGQSSVQRLVATALDTLSAGGLQPPQYLAVVDPESLEPTETAVAGNVVLLAQIVGNTRLIDNVILGPTMPPGLG